MKYIVRDDIYTEEFFDNLKVIIEKNIIPGGIRQKISRCRIGGIIVYNDPLIDVSLFEENSDSGDWFHSISIEEAYSYFISFTTAQKRNNKLNELGI